MSFLVVMTRSPRVRREIIGFVQRFAELARFFAGFGHSQRLLLGARGPDGGAAVRASGVVVVGARRAGVCSANLDEERNGPGTGERCEPIAQANSCCADGNLSRSGEALVRGVGVLELDVDAVVVGDVRCSWRATGAGLAVAGVGVGVGAGRAVRAVAGFCVALGAVTGCAGSAAAGAARPPGLRWGPLEGPESARLFPAAASLAAQSASWASRTKS